MKLSKFISVAAVLFVGIAAGACSGEPDATPSRICTPGALVFCRCQGGQQGQKLCRSNGASFEGCNACRGDNAEVETDGSSAGSDLEGKEPSGSGSGGGGTGTGSTGTGSGTKPGTGTPPSTGTKPAYPGADACPALRACCQTMQQRGNKNANSCFSALAVGSDELCASQQNAHVSAGDC